MAIERCVKCLVTVKKRKKYWNKQKQSDTGSLFVNVFDTVFERPNKYKNTLMNFTPLYMIS